jgi:hypothetical protein
MPTVDNEASVARAGWVRRTWEKIATVLAVIGLIDVSKQLIEWAEWVHWIATQYAIVRTWLFGWLPFHVPPELHDPIVLFLIFFSVTNVGLYRKTGFAIISRVRVDIWRVLPRFVGASLFLALQITFVAHRAYPSDMPFLNRYIVALTISFVGYGILGLIIAEVVFALIAWRWVLGTAAIFGALVAVNQVYVLWLEPLATH